VLAGGKVVRSFPDLASFAAYLARLPVAIQAAETAGLTAAALVIEKEAKAEIGHYQGEAGPLAAWAELADTTKADRRSKGFPENNPLLRSGELLHSIGHSVDGHHAVVGSTSDIAVYQEFGTPHAAHPIPQRSFLGGAAFRKGKDAADAAGKAVAHSVAGLRP
jgi:phage gpG-like protein